MQKITRFIAWITSVGMFAAAGLTPVISLAATTASIAENETVANVTTGADTQATATTSTTANTPETKATRTLTVANALPVGTVAAASVNFTIGDCVVTLGTVTQDLNCTDHAAAIATTTDSTATLIASRLLTVTGIADSGRAGGLTLTASSTSATSVVFTTTATETAATNITYTASTATNVSSPAANTVTGVIPVAQIWTYTPSNVEIGDIFTAIINGTTVSFTATAGTVANVTAGLTAAINASAVASAVTAVNTGPGTLVTITSDTAGTAFTLTKGSTNRAAVAQVVTFTPTNVDTANYSITLNGVTYTDTGDSTLKQVLDNLNTLLASDPAVSCTSDGTKLTCTSDTAGTSFTYSSSVTEYSGATSHHGGGGGGSSHSSSSTSSSSSSSSTSTSANADIAAQITALKAKLAALMAGTSTGTSVSATGSFTRDLQVGSTGADVKSLQVYLNAHGAAVASTGPGSMGNETMTFGAATRAALAKFQASAGISPASGYLGPKTRAYITAHP